MPENKKHVNSINDLNEQCFLALFDNLNFCALLNGRLVCKKWRNLIDIYLNGLTKFCYGRHYNQHQQINGKRSEDDYVISNDSLNMRRLSNILSKMPNLTSLKVANGMSRPNLYVLINQSANAVKIYIFSYVTKILIIANVNIFILNYFKDMRIGLPTAVRWTCHSKA